MDPIQEHQRLQHRRAFLRRGGLGLGAAALSCLLNDESQGQGASGLPHFPARAKRVIYLFQSGGPSQMDLFDYKPALENLRGSDLPESIRKGQRLTGMTSTQDRFPIAPSRFTFARHGQSGAWVSELLPHTSRMVDRMSFIKSMHTEAINHDPAITFFQSGAQLAGRPSMGAWISYGLGTENRDLPAFVVLISQGTGNPADQPLYDRLWGSGFLPSQYQGVKFRSIGDPVLFLSNPDGVNDATRRRILDDLAQLNQMRLRETGDPEIATRITQYELAYRMQSAVPELTNLGNEPRHVLDMYGPEVQRPGSFAANCLLARRLAERGVRFIQLFHRGWDQHVDLPRQIAGQCRDTDQPGAALLLDLEQRGLLDDTLVIWGGEFGRTVYCQGTLTAENYGRDHHPRCFTFWLAGGGIKPGFSLGETDDFSYNIVRDPVHVHDLHATMLHCLGIDHQRLTFRYQGRNHRLTDVAGNLVQEILGMTGEAIVSLLNELWQPGHFYVGNGMRLAWQFQAEQTLPWEIYRGNLLSPVHTRLERTFLAWNAFQVDEGKLAAEPMLSLLLDEAEGVIHVTRGILSYVWQTPKDSVVLEPVETTAWVRELVGTIAWADIDCPSPSAKRGGSDRSLAWRSGSDHALRDEITLQIHLAIVGTSRLPLTSVEAPLPAYSYGQLAYLHQPSLPASVKERPRGHWLDFINDWPDVSPKRMKAKLLETLIRSAAADEIAGLATLLASSASELPSLLRILFNQVSLSPYTSFVDHCLALLADLTRQDAWPVQEEIDFLAHLLQQQSRHLNAYDLVLFHHRGANYPDALVVDAVLQRLVALADSHPQFFQESQARRSAFRLGCVVRHLYQGHEVPSLPTSPGENMRVLPTPRVSEEELSQPNRRRRTLFAEAPLLLSTAGKEILRQSIADLHEGDSLLELGTALFIDRPLGYGKAPAERDQTPLVAHEAVSRHLARRRLRDLRKLAEELHLEISEWDGLHARLDRLNIKGFTVDGLFPDPRPTASLADARKVADDFVVVRTMPVGLRSLLGCFPGMPELSDGALLHFGPGPNTISLVGNGQRQDFDIDLSQGWTHRAGIEVPKAWVLASRR